MAFEYTDTLLGNAEVFTGERKLTDSWNFLRGTVFSDQSGTLHVEQSADGVNWDTDSTTAVTGGTGAAWEVTPVAGYWRLRYVNGATPQTVFRLSGRTYGERN